MLAADNKCYTALEAMSINESLLQKTQKPQSLTQFDANQAPEKIHTLLPEAYRTFANSNNNDFNLGTQRTTFYAQQQFDANQEPEKVHTLVPESYRYVPTDITRNPRQRTTFYAEEQHAVDPNSPVEKIEYP